MLDSYISIFSDLGYEVVVCSSISNQKYLNTDNYNDWIDLDDYHLTNKTNLSFTLFITYHHSIGEYLKELRCPVGLVIHNANYLFNINLSTNPKGRIHQISGKATGKSRLKELVVRQMNVFITRSTSMQKYVQQLTDKPVITIPDIYIKTHAVADRNNSRTIITHIGKIDQNLKNIKCLQKIISWVQCHPKTMSLNIIGDSKFIKITPSEFVNMYDDYIQSDLFSKIISDSDCIIFLPNKKIRVKTSMEIVGYSHIPGAIHDAARHIKHILVPAWYPKDDLLKELMFRYEDCEDIIQSITKKELGRKKVDERYFKLKIQQLIKEANIILLGIISDQ